MIASHSQKRSKRIHKPKKEKIKGKRARQISRAILRMKNQRSNLMMLQTFLLERQSMKT
jgi:hypothetical protein